jgi:hypothetical protein
MVPTAITARPSNATVRAWRDVALLIRRCATSVSFSPRTSDQMTNASRKKVVTLIPPAVPALPPPTNIRAQFTAIVSGVIWP